MSSRQVQKISSTSLADKARDMIRDAIFEGKIRPEERLPIERIAADLGVSRTPVREALKALDADGSVRIPATRGAVVRRFDSDELRDRYCVRPRLEGYAGEPACRMDTGALAEALEDNWAQRKAMLARGRKPARVRHLLEAHIPDARDDLRAGQGRGDAASGKES